MSQEKKRKGKMPKKQAQPINASTGRAELAKSDKKTKTVQFTTFNSSIRHGSNTDAIANGHVKHPSLGLSGVRFSGTQPCIKIATTIYEEYPMASVNNYGTVYDGAHQLINPMWLGGPLMYRAVSYDNYVFRRVKFIYNSCVTPTTTGINLSLAAAIVADPNVDTNMPNSFTAIRCTSPSIVTSVWVPTWSLEYRYNGPKIWYTSATASDTVAANMRDESQACLAMMFSAGATATLHDVGYLDIEYEIELYNPTFVQSSATLLKSLSFNTTLETRAKIKQLLAEFHSKVEEVKEAKSQEPSALVVQPGSQIASATPAHNSMLPPSLPPALPAKLRYS